MKKILLVLTVIAITVLTFFIVRKTMTRGGAFVAGALVGSTASRNRQDRDDRDYYRN